MPIMTSKFNFNVKFNIEIQLKTEEFQGILRNGFSLYPSHSQNKNFCIFETKNSLVNNSDNKKM